MKHTSQVIRIISSLPEKVFIREPSMQIFHDPVQDCADFPWVRLTGVLEVQHSVD